MSRSESSSAAAASSSTAAAQSVPLYLVVTKDSAGKICKVRLSSAPLEIKEKQISSVELTPAHIKSILFPADADLLGGRGPMTAIFRRRIASFATPLFVNPNNSEEKTKLSDFNIEEALHLQGDRLRRIALAISHAVNLETRPARNGTFFRENIDIPEDVLDAALNGDAHVVWLMLTQNPNYVSYRGTATITHLGIERTGTLLQMALYSHDEKLAAFIQKYMDPAEFRRQWEEVFLPDYNAFLARQQAEAARLCSELEDAFKAASATDVTNALNLANTTSALQTAVAPALNLSHSIETATSTSNESRTASATSSASPSAARPESGAGTAVQTALQTALNCFKDNLEQYVRENKVHNPYILQRLFEIYNTPTFNDWSKDCLLSQQAIGLAEKLSSAVWHQHIAQGIYNLGKNDSPDVAGRSYLAQNSVKIDIRSLSRLYVDCCVDIFGALSSRRAAWWGGTGCGRGANLAFVAYQNLCRAKTAGFQNLYHREYNRLSA